MRTIGASLDEIETIYRRDGPDFFRLALAQTGNIENARDAVQDGFGHAIRGRHSYRGTGSLDAWIARCVLNAARDITRQRRRLSNEEAPPNRAGCEEKPRDSDVDAVRKAVRKLPQRQRDALYLRFYLDFDYSSIAHVLDVKIGTVSALLHSARTSLAKNLLEV